MKPKVSIILAVFNEEKIIKQSVLSLLNQKKEFSEHEILVVDGKSEDQTPEIVRELTQSHPQVIFVHNEKRTTPAAFNLGIEIASGDFIAIFGAHALYADDYIEVCLQEIKDKNVDACSGMVEMVKYIDNKESDLCLSILNSKIGVSGSSFRTRKPGIVESIPYGVFKKEVFDTVGNYNEALLRNQDNDMNYRIGEAGYKLYLTNKTSSKYYPKQTVKSLLNYSHNNGKWNAYTVKMGNGSLRWIHFVPFFFTLYILILVAFWGFQFFLNSGALFQVLSILPLSFYSLLLVSAAIRIKVKYNINRLLFPITVFRFHMRYGLGTLIGIFTRP
jgi:glycosyltransferase involved in cell wall biosynthesis